MIDYLTTAFANKMERERRKWRRGGRGRPKQPFYHSTSTARKKQKKKRRGKSKREKTCDTNSCSKTTSLVDSLERERRGKGKRGEYNEGEKGEERKSLKS